ncbi:MAG TPA: copper chaperone PCu(A)C [Roseiflexaceae bacterium]|nr:copper chaperone PCu(A)C [Roseiflexaceae bacterium]
MHIRALLSLFVVALALGACGAAPNGQPAGSASITVTEAWTRPAGQGDGQERPASAVLMPVGGTMSAFMTIRNGGGAADRLIGVESDAAKFAMLHHFVESHGAQEMAPVDAIEVPAQGDLALKPGGFHVMLVSLTRDLNTGDTIDLKLRFAQAGLVTVRTEVRAK